MLQRILITPNKSHFEIDNYEYAISVEDLLSNITRSDVIETTNQVSGLDVPNTGSIEFEILWWRIAKPQTNNLVRSILLFQQLTNYLEEKNIKNGTLVCGDDLNEKYTRVVKDVAETTSLNFERQEPKSPFIILSVIFKLSNIFGKMGVVLTDWFIARLNSLFTDPSKTDITYFPAIERLDSTLPVIKNFKTKPHTIISEPSIYYHFRLESKQALDEYNPAYANQFLSFPNFVGQIRDLGTIFREIVMLDSFAPDLANALEEEFDINLQSSTKSLVRETLTNFHLVRALVLRRSFNSIFANNKIKGVLIGTLDPIGRAIVHESAKQDIKVYHIPHSIATTFPPNPGSEVIQFLSGDLDVDYYEKVVPEDQKWKWVPLGRPYLGDLFEKYNDQRNKQQSVGAKQNREKFHILIATQPFPDKVRKSFIEVMLKSFDREQFNVTVKPHPDESEEFYEEFKSNFEHFHVITKDLYDEIDDSDLTVTISSNVGLESIIIGTPTICYNSWEPFVLEQTFAITDEVPVFRSKNMLNRFVNKINQEKLSQLQKNQKAFIEDSYILSSTISSDIAKYIEADSKTE